MNFAEKLRDIFKGPIVLFPVVAFIPARILFLLPVFIRMAGIEDTATSALVSWSAAMWMPGPGAIIATRTGGGLTSVYGWLALAALVGILYWKKEIPLRQEENVSRET